MAVLDAKTFDSPDEVRPFVSRGRMEVVNLAGISVGKGTFEPGWRWSEHVGPIAGTDSCQASHLGYMLSGRMHVVMDDGSEAEAGPGMIVVIESGHDAWTVGEEPCVFLDFGSSVGQYAAPR